MKAFLSRWFEACFYPNPFALLFFVSAFLIAFMGIYIYTRSPQSKLHAWFFGICSALFLWLFMTGFVFACHDSEWLDFFIKWMYFGVSFIPVTFFTYSSVWLGFQKKQRSLIGGGFAACTIFIGLIFFTPWIVIGHTRYSWGAHSLLSTWGGGFYLLYFVFFMLFFALNLMWGYREACDELRRSQIRVILVGFFLGVFGTADFLPGYHIDIFPVGAFTTTVFASSIAYTIIRYKFLDIQTVIHKTILWVLTTVAFLAPIAALAYFFYDFWLSLSRGMLSFFVLVIAYLFLYYVRFVQPLVDQAFQRRMWNLNQVLQRFTDELTHLKTLEELANHILQTVAKTLYPQEGTLLLWDEGRAENLVFSPDKTVYKSEASRFEPLFRFLGGCPALLQSSYIDMDPQFEPVRAVAADYFEAMNAKVCVPIVLEQRLIGMINLSGKSNLKKYSAAELRFLSDLRGSAAIAISNSLRLIAMQASLRKWNEELEKQVNERTKELKEAQAQLIQAEKLATIGTLAGGVAHEINNPLAAILTNAQMLLMENLKGDTKESVELIEEAAERCRTIVQKLMKYSRKQPQEEVLQSVDLKEVVEHTVSFLKYQLEQENIRVSIACPAENCFIRGNANELSQVFTNLILNARDALQTRAIGRLIQIRSSVNREELTVSVEDNGCGISKEHVSKIFDPFFTTKDVGKGTGLGLSIVQGIVQKCGGRFDVKSEVGTGTTISIVFPRVK